MKIPCHVLFLDWKQIFMSSPLSFFLFYGLVGSFLDASTWSEYVITDVSYLIYGAEYMAYSGKVVLRVNRRSSLTRWMNKRGYR